MQGLLTSLLLPPLALVLGAVLAGLLAWRGWRGAGLLAALAAFAQLALATPFVAGWLAAGLEARIPPPPVAPAAGAIVILGGDSAGADVGAFTLERLRAGAELHRRTGLPILVTGGVLGRGQPPIAALMASSLERDFGVRATWVEVEAADTRQNAQRSAAMLRPAGIEAAWVVTHAWHMPRAAEAFARSGFPAWPAPLRRRPPPEGVPSDFVPRADHLGTSWYMLREWAGRLVYALRGA